MKQTNYRNIFGFIAASVALSSTAALAGPPEVMAVPAPPIEVPDNDVVSGSFSLDANTHFISYGFDIWGDGEDFGDFGFYPSAELAFALSDNLSATLGFWMEFNNKGGDPLGDLHGESLQELDVWAGLAYTVNDFTVGLTYQEWLYGSDSERVLDLAFSYDGILSPSLTIHGRLDEGASGGNEGIVAVLGVAHSIEAGAVTITFPASIAFFFEDDYHPGSTDSGLGYGSIGVNAAVSLAPLIGDTFGDWDLHAGVDYYITSDDVVGNDDDEFLTGNIGVGLSF